jgi:myo-inositol 2-dehydrogenase/D-chiro-inositol 1-dehydrogenase/scyllo-inositol 2-dehydrogenase (NAD+)
VDQQHALVVFSAVYDSDEDAAKAAGERLGCEVCGTWEDLLGSGTDAVYLAGPPAEREALALQCAQAGKHVLCEAPMGTTPESCRRMAAACEEHNVLLMEADLQRFLPAYHYMRKIVKSGLIGDVYLARAYEGLNGIAAFSLEDDW